MAQARSTSQNRVPPRARSRSPISRPTTPLRPSSRSSFRTSQTGGAGPVDALESLEPQFAELSDAMADLEANFMHLQLMHESLSRFGESFASFLYGLNMNAFVVDFPEAPMADSIRRWQDRQREGGELNSNIARPKPTDGETTFMTNDASFASMKATPRRKSMAPPVTPTTRTTTKSSIPSTRGGVGTRGRGAARGATRSGLPRGRGRGAR